MCVCFSIDFYWVRQCTAVLCVCVSAWRQCPFLLLVFLLTFSKRQRIWELCGNFEKILQNFVRNWGWFKVRCENAYWNIRWRRMPSSKKDICFRAKKSILKTLSKSRILHNVCNFCNKLCCLLKLNTFVAVKNSRRNEIYTRILWDIYLLKFKYSKTLI